MTADVEQVLGRLTGVLEEAVVVLKALKSQNSSALLSKDEVAARVGKSVRFVERAVKAGKLKKVPNLGRCVSFAPAEVEKWLSDVKQFGRRRL